MRNVESGRGDSFQKGFMFPVEGLGSFPGKGRANPPTSPNATTPGFTTKRHIRLEIMKRFQP